MKRVLSVFLIILFCNAFMLTSFCQARIIRGGKLTVDEVWEGEVLLTENIIIPEGRKLTIKPGTKILYKTKNGQEKKVPDFVVNGTLKIKDEEKSDSSYTMLSLDDKKTQIIEFTPYEVDTKILRDEFRSFKEQYAWIWITFGVFFINTLNNK